MNFFQTFESYNENNTVFYHGTTDKGFFGKNGIHVGTKLAATEALEARIGVPAEGEWDGTREYGKTLLAGRKTLARRSMERYGKDRSYKLTSGYNCYAPEEDYYPTEQPKRATYSDQTQVAFDCKPIIFPVKIIGKMHIRTLTDSRANSRMIKNIKEGNLELGYYYVNEGEDEGSISAVVPDGTFLEIL